MNSDHSQESDSGLLIPGVNLLPQLDRWRSIAADNPTDQTVGGALVKLRDWLMERYFGQEPETDVESGESVDSAAALTWGFPVPAFRSVFRPQASLNQKKGQTLFGETTNAWKTDSIQKGLTPFLTKPSPLSLTAPLDFAAFHSLPLVWFPRGLPPGHSVSLHSSRLSTKLDHQDPWFDGLRTLAIRIANQVDLKGDSNQQQRFWVSAPGTTTDRFLRRISQLFGIPVMPILKWDQLSVGANGWPLESSWDTSLVYPAYYGDMSLLLSPLSNVNRSNDRVTQNQKEDTKSERQQLDPLLMRLSVEAYLMAVRPAGAVERGALQRLTPDYSQPESQSSNASDADALPSTWLLINAELTAKKVQQQLLHAGAIGWYLYDNTDDPRKDDVDESGESGESRSRVSIDQRETKIDNRGQPDQALPMAFPFIWPPAPIRLDEFPEAEFLLHWTRRCSGPWPDQSEAEFLDDLIFRSQRRRHGELESLVRITACGRILGSRRLTRDQRPVVCFSNRRISELPSLKIFRSHLNRWDFLPYGVAVQREWLSARGCRPVIYGNEATWQSLSSEDRVFFQQATSSSGNIDWTLEQEWRLPGDLELSRIPLHQVALFVPDHTMAEKLRPFSRWQIVIIGEDDHDE